MQRCVQDHWLYEIVFAFVAWPRLPWLRRTITVITSLPSGATGADGRRFGRLLRRGHASRLNQNRGITYA